MDAVTAEGRAAGRLIAEKDAMANEVTRLLYEERPELTVRYGAVGRERCLEDIRFTIEHLIPAVELGRPAMFVTYVTWLDELLRARNVATRDVNRSLELLERIARARLAAAEADAVAGSIRAGLAALPATTTT